MPKIHPKQILGGVLLDRVNTALSIVASTVETTIYSVTIPANLLGINGVFQANIIGTFTNNSVLLGTTYMIRVKLGGVTIYQDTSPNVGLSANLRAFNYALWLVNRNNLASQTGGGQLNLSEAGVPTVGVGVFSATDIGNGVIRFASSVANTALDQIFSVTIQHTSGAANVATVREFANSVVYPT